MREDVWKQAEQFRDAKRRRKRLYRGIGVMGCVAVLCTVSALMKPAITLEQYVCGLEEHTHTSECYETMTVEKVSLNCTKDLHEHTQDCLDEEENTICGYEDFYIHAHEDSCYEEDALICPLEEIEEHTHSLDCYETTQVLTCQEPETAGHSHTEDCYAQEQTLTCEKPEAVIHEEHTDSCYDPDDPETLICQLPILKEHTHDGSCMEVQEIVEQVLVCELEEHTHGDECRENAQSTQEEQISEEPAADSAEPTEAVDPSTLWSDMTDEEFVAWVTSGDNDDYLLEIYQDVSATGDSTRLDTLSERISAIFDNTEDYDTAVEYYLQAQNYVDDLWGIGEVSTLAETPEGTALTEATLKSMVGNSSGAITLSDESYYLEDDIDMSNVTKTLTNSNNGGNFNDFGGSGNSSTTYQGYYLKITGTVTLDLNGNVLKGRDTYCVIVVTSGGELTIKDSSPNEVHYGSVSNNLWTYDSKAKSGVEIDGGIITGGGRSTSSSATGSYRHSGIVVDHGSSLIIEAGTIAGNRANNDTLAGGGIDCYGSSTSNGTTTYSSVTMTGGRICYNYSGYNGGGMFASGIISISNATIDHNYAEKYGGGIRVATQFNTTFTMSDSTVSDNIAKIDGGGIEFSMGHDNTISQATAQITATFTKTTITDNKAETGNGGGISMSQESQYSALVTINAGTEITGNSAAKNGGGLYLEYGTVNLAAGTISKNTATVNGGGIAVNDGDFTMAGGVVQSNTAKKNGGGGYVSGGDVTMSGGQFDNNTAEANGGGIAVSGGKFEITSGVVQENTASQDGGGGYVSGGDVTISGGQFDNNTAEANGGGIAVSGGKFEITGGVVQENTASQDGGGGYVSGGNVTISGGQFDNNTATNGDGGGIAVDYDTSGKVTISGGDITENQAISGYGGGVAVSNGTLEMTGGTVEKNTAQKDGGGCYVTGDKKTSGDVTITDGTFTGNIATENGGGIAVSAGSFGMAGGTVEKNIAQKDGGGCYVTGGNVTLEDGIFSENQATQNGGGLAVNDGNFTMTGGTLKENTAIIDGGGGYVTGGSVNMEGGIFQGNTAAINGGGLAVESTSEEGFSMTAGKTGQDANIEFSSNTATNGNGGGIYLNGVSFALHSALVSGNKADNWDELASTDYGNGGGVYVKDANFTMTGGTVTDNECTRFGGGVYIWSPKTDNQLTGGTISKNRAAQCGGGLAVYQCETALNGSVTIDSNTATLGGGVYVRWGSELNMSGGTISNNHAHSMELGHAHDGEDSEFFTKLSNLWNNGKGKNMSMTFAESNTASNPDYGGNGGGVFLFNSKFTMAGGTITGNSAARNGGGILAVHTNSTLSGNQSDEPMSLTISNGEISDNTAEKHGGAVCMVAYDWRYDGGAGDGNLVSDGCTYDDDNTVCAATFSGTTVVHNNTAENGGGFYVGGGILSVKGGVIRYNQAVGEPRAGITTAKDANEDIGVGGGIFVYHAGSLEMSNVSTMGIYSNTADFAADDVFCSPASHSALALPSVVNMVLTDYYNHRIGMAEAWFEDYPDEDSAYDDRMLDGIQIYDTVASGSGQIVRYRTAVANIAKVASPLKTSSLSERKVAFNVPEGGRTLNNPIDQYACLTLGYKLTRTSLTITKQLVDAAGDEMSTEDEYSFTVTITGTVDPLDKNYEEGTLHVYQKTEEQYTVISDTEDSDEGPGSAVVEFTLKAGQSVTLEGIPIGATVEVKEASGEGYTTSYREEDGSYVLGSAYTLENIEQDSSITCVNAASYQLPSTGGAGDGIYTFSGIVLVTVAVVCWKRRRRAA